MLAGMSKSTLFVSALLAALALASPAAGHPHDGDGHCRDGDRELRALGPEETARMRERVERRIERAGRRIEELASAGVLTPEQLQRARALRERVVQRTRQIFADGRVSVDEHRELRSLKREARALKRELREHVRDRRHRRSRSTG
jgi:hypothetical protein